MRCECAHALDQDGGSTSTEFRGVRAGLLALLLIGLSACITTVDRPSPPSAQDRANGLTYEKGVEYLDGARNKVLAAQSSVDQLDAGSKFGIAAGLAGAGASSIFRAHSATILAFLTGSAVSYSVNKSVDPLTLSDLYKSAVNNMDCIDKSAASARRSVVGSKVLLERLKPQIYAAAKALADDIQAADGNGRYDTSVTMAEDNIETARKSARDIDSYLLQADNFDSVLSESMIGGVNDTLTALNAEIRARTPNAEAISQSGSIYASFAGMGASMRQQVRASLDGFKNNPVTVAEADPLLVKFRRDEDELKDLLARVPTTLTPPTTAGVSSCQVQFSALALVAVTVEPVGPIDLSAGTSVAITPHGKPPYHLIWTGQGKVPTDVDISNSSLEQIALSARASAADGSYALRVVDYSGQSSSDVTLNVHAKSTPGVSDQSSPTPGTGDEQQQILKSENRSSLAALMGLDKATIETSPEWTARVKTLEPCFKIKPPSGYLGQSLLNELKALAKPIDSKGTCPTSGAGTGGPPPPPGAH